MRKSKLTHDAPDGLIITSTRSTTGASLISSVECIYITHMSSDSMKMTIINQGRIGIKELLLNLQQIHSYMG